MLEIVIAAHCDASLLLLIPVSLGDLYLYVFLVLVFLIKFHLVNYGYIILYQHVLQNI